MGLLNIGEEIGSKASGFIGSKIGKAAFGLGAVGLFAAGAVKQSGRSAIEAGNEAAFGDQNADKYFMGQQGLSPSGVFDAYTSPGMAKGISATRAGIGAIGGGLIAAAAGRAIKSSRWIKRSCKYFRKSSFNWW